jgi:hypothetical protein
MPKFMTDKVDRSLFPRQEGMKEGGIQWRLVFRGIAKEKDGVSYSEKVNEMRGTTKGSQEIGQQGGILGQRIFSEGGKRRQRVWLKGG